VYILDDLRGNDLARSAPCREAVEDDDVVAVDGLLESGSPVDAILLARCLHHGSRHRSPSFKIHIEGGQTHVSTLWTPILLIVVLKGLCEAGVDLVMLMMLRLMTKLLKLLFGVALRVGARAGLETLLVTVRNALLVDLKADMKATGWWGAPKYIYTRARLSPAVRFWVINWGFAWSGKDQGVPVWCRVGAGVCGCHDYGGTRICVVVEVAR
jgi:hypothetical protein